MLRFLSIRNLALIDRLELEFDGGFSVLTGETGAGKSMLVGAVALLVGGRASADLVRTGEAAATVDAVFEDSGGQEIVLRRDVSAQSGRSRAFIDNGLVTSAALREVGAGLVDLHGQHEHQRLLDPASHLDLLDAFAGVDRERAAVATAFATWQELLAERNRLTGDSREKTRRREYVAFQLAEITRVAPRPGEDEELAATRQVLANSERLRRLCEEAYAALYEGEHAALPALAAVWRRVAELSSIEAQFVPYAEARDGLKSQLEDLAFFLRSYSAGIDDAPGRLQEVEDRLAELDRLKRKHGATLADVLGAAASLDAELSALADSDSRAAVIEAELADARARYLTVATELSQARRTAAHAFAARLGEALQDLAMARTQFEVRFAEGGGDTGWTAQGLDDVEFFISPNPGEELRPLARVASGGELSRIMLALKRLASTDAPGKTLIFDEVDAGIGGAVADVVGARLREVSQRFQVLCITHLPQIAAYATAHYRIEKEVRDGRTATRVTRLGVREREEELARMIAGAGVSASVRASAREMLRRRGE